MGESYYHREHDHGHDHQQQEDLDDEEEALSLCDLPLDNTNLDNETINMSIYNNNNNKSSSEIFEFLSDLSSSEMSSAEDLFFCGKLIPLKHNSNSPTTQNLKPHFEKHTSNHVPLRRRSESLSSLMTREYSSSNYSKTTLMRNSRSLDDNYRKLEMLSSMTMEGENVERNYSVKSAGKGDVMAKKAVKPRWFVLMFGLVRPPQEMELRDIKSRQFRRNSSKMFPSQVEVAAGKKLPESPCKLLRLLSCKAHASVAVATSYG